MTRKSTETLTLECHVGMYGCTGTRVDRQIEGQTKWQLYAPHKFFRKHKQLFCFGLVCLLSQMQCSVLHFIFILSSFGVFGGFGFVTGAFIG